MRLLVPSLALLLTASLASAQSLADVARKEAERRRALPSGGKAYTNSDLKPVPQPPPTAGDPDKDPADAAADDKDRDSDKRSSDAAKDDSKTEKGDQAKGEVRDQEYWSKRKAALIEQLERDQTYAAALQSRIDALTMDFVNRDDPAQRDQIALDRQRAVTELDRLKKSIEEQQRALDEFEEEARRSGVPPGWLR